MVEFDKILQSLKHNCDVNTIANFYNKYYDDLVDWSYSIVLDLCAAEDIVQDFFVDFLDNKKYNLIKSLIFYNLNIVITNNSCIFALWRIEFYKLKMGILFR